MPAQYSGGRVPEMCLLHGNSPLYRETTLLAVAPICAHGGTDDHFGGIASKRWPSIEEDVFSKCMKVQLAVPKTGATQDLNAPFRHYGDNSASAAYRLIKYQYTYSLPVYLTQAAKRRRV